MAPQNHHTSVRKVIKLPENDWLVKTNSFLSGDFRFMLNTDWMAKKQLNVNSINRLNSRQNIFKKIRIL